MELFYRQNRKSAYQTYQPSNYVKHPHFVFETLLYMKKQLGPEENWRGKSSPNKNTKVSASVLSEENF